VIRFRPGEFRVLEALLLARPDRALQMNELIERVWPDPAVEPETASWVVKRYLSDLRRLGVPIETVRGFGYRIPEANRGNYTSRRIVSLASPHCVGPHASRSNRGRVWRSHSRPSKVPGVGGDYRNGRDRGIVHAE
jgi:hypothetical protein